MLFTDRTEAGKRLLPLLQAFKGADDTVVIGLPRGGVVLASVVAQDLDLPLDVVFPKKVGAPYNPELAIGAVTETGEGFFNQDLIESLDISESMLQEAGWRAAQAAQQRLNAYRKICEKIPLQGKTVILVDDGLATGATMKASIQAVRAEGAARVIVAVPVAPPDTEEEVRALADEVFCVATPAHFAAVGQFYRNFSATEDDEVLDLLQKSRKRG